MNVLMPMAGEGLRLKGYSPAPKPLIIINNYPMFMWALNNVSLDNNFIFVVKDEDINQYRIHAVVSEAFPKSRIIAQRGKSDGAVISTLLAQDLIDNDDPLLIVDCDILVSVDYEYLNSLTEIDAAVVVSKNNLPNYSYVKINKNGLVTKIKEKEVISDYAVSGVYYWKKGSDYVKYAKKVIKKNKRINNEFYVSQVYEEAIKDKQIVVAIVSDIFFHLGTEEEIYKYLESKNDNAT